VPENGAQSTTPPRSGPGPGADDAVLRVEHVSKRFATSGALGLASRVVHAVSDVSFSVARGEVVSVVGETGSGKTTLGSCISGLTVPTSGRVLFKGVDIAAATREQRAELRRRIQPVFQDPRSSLDPRWTVERTIREPLDAYHLGSPHDRRVRVAELMERVGLPGFLARRRPHQLSGGQQQRVAIAAALALGPELLVADEPVSALDVSVQAQILNLFDTLRADLGLAILFISHDLSVVEHVSDRVMVMYLGKLAELGTVAQVFDTPVHPYTKALLSAIPRPDPRARRLGQTLGDEITSAPSLETGCVFAPRCPEAVPACSTRAPEEREYAPGHVAACLVAAAAVRAVSVAEHVAAPSVDVSSIRRG
jgi:peptide/nickel transport system ATP-binding protein/oligopeptide transport system ATP-binding protein